MSLGNLLRGSSPAIDAVDVTPSDATEFDPPLRGLYIGTSGDLVVTMAGGTVVTLANAPIGYHPLCVSYIMAATTAADIVGLR
jgi:hypothetical protein